MTARAPSRPSVRAVVAGTAVVLAASLTGCAAPVRPPVASPPTCAPAPSPPTAAAAGGGLTVRVVVPVVVRVRVAAGRPEVATNARRAPATGDQVYVGTAAGWTRATPGQERDVMAARWSGPWCDPDAWHPVA